MLVRLIIQNRGGLSKGKKESEFPKLTNEEIKEIEATIREFPGSAESFQLTQSRLQNKKGGRIYEWPANEFAISSVRLGSSMKLLIKASAR